MLPWPGGTGIHASENHDQFSLLGYPLKWHQLRLEATNSLPSEKDKVSPALVFDW